jgi:hypothetical protein
MKVAVIGCLCVAASVPLWSAQAQNWIVSPRAPTVGDTIRVERVVAAPAGWTVRVAGPADWGETAEVLGPPLVAPVRGGDGWLVAFTVAAWAPGPVSLQLPAVVRTSADGAVDSLAREWVGFEVASVLPVVERPDTLAPKPALPPLVSREPSAWPAVGALLVACLLLLAGFRWRHRAPRDLSAPAPQTGGNGAGSVPDQRWIGAGEYRAVAARAMAELRGALADAAPDIPESLSVEQCAARLEASHASWPVRELVETLQRLEQAAFAAAVGPDVADLAARARALKRDVIR